MPVIYFLRHGETDWNVEQRMQGQLEVPINANGRVQAARNGRVLRDLLGESAGRFDFVASPQLRTRQTMEIVRAGMGLDPAAYRTDDRLREIHKGDWQGFLWSEMSARFPEAFTAYERDRWNVRPPGEGAESYADLYARACAWLDAVARDTMVVSHGGPMRCIRRHVMELDDEATLLLTAPQDRVLRIENGELRWI
jgi:broad specificity phosphatase PhoE